MRELFGLLRSVDRDAVRIAPSLLAADFLHLADDVRDVTSAGAEFLHLDIMDGHFVPNISFGPSVVRQLRGVSSIGFDVHLMLSEPSRYIPQFLEAGADVITVHVESSGNISDALSAIHAGGASAGVVLKPGTPASAVYPYLERADMVLVMTVEPGFGGQSFMPGQVSKIRRIRDAIDRCGRPVHLEVDGGITVSTAPAVIEAGADILVAGSSVFGCKGSRSEAVKALRCGR